MATMATSGGAADHNEQPAKQPAALTDRQPLSLEPTALQLAAASLAAGENDELEAERRRQQRLREQIDQLKMSIPAAKQQHQPPGRTTFDSTQRQQQQQLQPRQPRHQPQLQPQPEASALGPERFAPLASFDFSITADNTTTAAAAAAAAAAATATTATTSAASSRPGNSNEHCEQVATSNEEPSPNSSSTFETPTLSGYVDCDELSDMVDGSLFEITNAGCLSRSVFGAGPVRGARAAAREERPTEPDEGDRTPTNGHEPAEWPARSHFEFRPEAIRGHDYSSTSSVPHLARSHVGASAAAAAAATCSQPRAATTCNKQSPAADPRRHHAKTNVEAARPKRTSASETGDSAPADHEAAADADGGARQRQQQQPPRARSKSNSMLNRQQRAGETDGDALNRRCPICCGQQRELGSQRAAANKKQGKRRFTFSLFSLFGGGGGRSDGQANQAHNLAATCYHHLTQTTNQINGNPIKLGEPSAKAVSSKRQRRHVKAAREPSQQRAGARNSQSSKGPGPVSAMRLRDSIKITNQRKQRSTRPRPSSEHADEELLPGTGEVLLDLSGATRHSSGSIKQQSAANVTATSATTTTTATTSTTTTRNKSVKFTTPDRVMFLSPEPPAVNSRSGARNSNHNNPQRRPGLLSGSQSSSQLTESKPAPIIKRPNVPKSSSYSQTEPNKGLDELLAKYEQNIELVAEINEKLNLNERISSNKSLLDHSLSSSSSVPSQEDSKASIPRHSSQLDPLDGSEDPRSTVAEQTPGQVIEFETEDVDEELLEALHRRLDALDAEQVAHDDMDLPLENFSNCDCNQANGGTLVSRTSAAGTMSTRIQAQAMAAAAASTKEDKT